MKRIVKSVLFVATMVSLAAACQSKKAEDTTSTTESNSMSSDSSMMSDTTMATDSMAADSAK